MLSRMSLVLCLRVVEFRGGYMVPRLNCLAEACLHIRSKYLDQTAFDLDLSQLSAVDSK